MLSYYFLAFVDILGFSQMVKRDCQGNPDGPQYLPLIREALLEVRESDPEANFKVLQFSDSIVISRRFDSNPNVFVEFVATVGSLQARLFSRGILSRGGVAHGKHSEEDDIIFSQALVEAYRLESTVATFPRTVISNDLLLLFPRDGCSLATDRDGAVFVDYLRDILSDDACASFKKINSSNLGNDQRVNAKLRWLSDYMASRFPEAVDVAPVQIAFH